LNIDIIFIVLGSNYITKGVKINCYAIDKFFVEVVLDVEQNVITEIKSFKSGSELDKYSPEVLIKKRSRINDPLFLDL